MITGTDDVAFWRQGYAAVMVTDTAFYRYRHYHGPLDTPEKLSYPEMAQVITGLAKTIAALAGEPIGSVGFSVHPN